MALFDTFRGWFGLSGALAERRGTQLGVPGVALVPESRPVGPDAALQIATVWACVERRANTIASLPLFVYEQVGGQKELARNSRLYQVLHDAPNPRMTPFEFWRALLMNYDLRGNGYARIERDERGEVTALWPMPSDQVETIVLPDGSVVHVYTLDGSYMVLADENVLHLKNLGNGTLGLRKLEFMRSTTDEAAKAQDSATRLFGTGGKPTGVLMIDHVLRQDQREAIQARFGQMATGSASRLYVLEADMKYQQLSLSPEDQELLESRRFGVSELCRWFDVPPVLVHHDNVTTWGSGIYEIKDGFYTLTIAPLLKNIEQAVRKRVLSPAQRARMHVEFAFDALLRANAKDRADLYAKHVQNGIMTRNEVRQLENLPPMVGADDLTAQSNLVPLSLMGKTTNMGGSNAPAQNPVAQ